MHPPPTMRRYGRQLLACNHGDCTAPDLAERLYARMRDCTSFGPPGHIRIATRTPHENARLLAAWPF